MKRTKKVPVQRSKKNNPINIAYQNVRGLRTKLHSWRQNAVLIEADLIAITETNLNASITDAEASPPRWNLLRRDRGAAGGGVLLAVRPGILVRRRNDLETENCEDLWVSVSFAGQVYHICVIYISPSAKDEEYMSWFCKVEDNIAILKNGNIVILGDLNLNSANVNVNNYMAYFTTLCNISDRNNIINSHGSKLDVVVVSDSLQVVSVLLGDQSLVHNIDKYHPPLDICIETARPVEDATLEPSNIDSSTDWNFSKADFPKLYELVEKINWDTVLSEKDVDRATERMYNLLYECFDLCIPKKNSRRYPTWYTYDIIRDLKRKCQIHKIWKQTNDQHVYSFFKAIRADIKLRLSAAYMRHIDHIETNLSNDPRAFWKHINNLRSKGGFDPRIFQGDIEYTGRAAANAFADYFRSVFHSQKPELNPANANSNTTANNRLIIVSEFSEDEVAMCINKLKPNSSAGPDNVPPYLIKALKTQFLIPLGHIYNLSLNKGVYPKHWKLTRVTPIPKGSKKTHVEDYRPIAVLSAFAKVF